MKPDLIESSKQMEELLAQLEGEKLIAVDTEFFRETTYSPQLALVQVATDKIVACIDPLAFDAKPALRSLLLDETITKIFHSCSQDLEVLCYYLGARPETLVKFALVPGSSTVQAGPARANPVCNRNTVKVIHTIRPIFGSIADALSFASRTRAPKVVSDAVRNA